MFAAMLRFCPTALGTTLLALCGGCAAPSIEGRWKGPLPLAGADACVIRLESGSRFTAVCGTRWIGRGLYTQGKDRLTLNFAELAHEGAPASPMKLGFETRSEGNTLILQSQSARTLSWIRSLDP
jgi:hypothetical protein